MRVGAEARSSGCRAEAAGRRRRCWRRAREGAVVAGAMLEQAELNQWWPGALTCEGRPRRCAAWAERRLCGLARAGSGAAELAWAGSGLRWRAGMSRELVPGGGVGREGASGVCEREALVVAERAGEIEATWGVRIDAGGGRAAMQCESWRSLTGRAGFSRTMGRL
jgi:hypothetical protein